MPRSPRLSSADLASMEKKIGEAVSAAIRCEVPKAIHSEFLRLGLATHADDDQLAAQKDFAWVRDMRLASEQAKSLVGSQIIKWILACLGLALAAGVGVILHRAS